MLPNLSKIGVVIMAAGKGTRLNCHDRPKVMLNIGGRPIVSYAVNTLKQVGFKSEQICLVVGFKKENIQDYFKDQVIYAEQTEQLGTGHAAFVGMQKLSVDVEQVLVMGGDDGAFYTPQTLLNFISEHLQNEATVSFLTATVADPASFGRVVRLPAEIKIIEKEYLSADQKNIKEVNVGTYLFDRNWYQNNFANFPKMQKLGEFGINPAITVAQMQGKKVQAIKLSDNNEWHGINTLAELELADQLKNN